MPSVERFDQGLAPFAGRLLPPAVIHIIQVGPILGTPILKQIGERSADGGPIVLRGVSHGFANGSAGRRHPVRGSLLEPVPKGQTYFFTNLITMG
jgi:hypothetical protein